jgi:hypothetical protein
MRQDGRKDASLPGAPVLDWQTGPELVVCGLSSCTALATQAVELGTQETCVFTTYTYCVRGRLGGFVYKVEAE